MSYPNIIEHIESRLPKTGGTITGVLCCLNELSGGETNPDNTFDIRAMRDTNGGSAGGSIRLFNKNRSQFPGGFELQARTKSDTSDLYILRGTTDGVLTWNGADVITSHGGDMSGRLNYNIAGDAVTLCGNDEGTTRIVLRSDLSNKGAFLNLYGINYSNSKVTNGGFQLVACSNGSDYKVLTGCVDGTLQWIGNDVVCVSRWTSGSSWYRKYSDGWIEQGGIATVTWETVTFVVPFSNTNYTSLITPLYHNTQTIFNWSITSKTTSKMIVTSGDSSGVTNRPCCWYACGY